MMDGGRREEMGERESVRAKDQVRGQDMGSLLVQSWTLQQLQGRLWMGQNEVMSRVGGRLGSKVTVEDLLRLSAIGRGVWCCGG